MEEGIYNRQFDNFLESHHSLKSTKNYIGIISLKEFGENQRTLIVYLEKIGDKKYNIPKFKKRESDIPLSIDYLTINDIIRNGAIASSEELIKTGNLEDSIIDLNKYAKDYLEHMKSLGILGRNDKKFLNEWEKIINLCILL